jgi:hypothetical protein
MPQLDVICDLGINFNMDNSWTSWTLGIEFFLAILVESDSSLTWDKLQWNDYLVLFLCICRTSKSDVVWMLYLNLKPRWSYTPSWTRSQTLEFQIGLDLQLDVRISLPLHHPLDVSFILFIISMIPNNN